jgi:TIR domain-containing protein
MSAPIFISFASKDHGLAETICAALENRGFSCWISSRDIDPGDNFQIAIVHAIRSAKVMVLVFSSNSNNSDEIKKELVLAGQSRLIVIPVRVEDVTPDEAFAYEFATRQWIDAFDDWEQSIGRLVGQLRRVGGIEPDAPAAQAPVGQEASAHETAVIGRHEESREPHPTGAADTSPTHAVTRETDGRSPSSGQMFGRHPIVVLSIVAGGIAALVAALTLGFVDLFQKPAPKPPAPAPQAQVQLPKPPAPPAAAPVAAHPLIQSVSPILPQPDQKIVITGSGFGQLAPYVGNSAYIQLSDATGWNAGFTRDAGGDLVTLAISSWTDAEIALDGLRGSYGRNNWTLNPGDRVQVRIWNVQTKAGPATFTTAVLLADAAVKDIQLTRSAVSGVASGIAFAGRWDRNCQALPSSVTIVRPPANGAVAVIRADEIIPASTPASGDTGLCSGKTVPANEIMYRSNPGFHGTDTVAYFSLGGSLVVSTTVTINVP